MELKKMLNFLKFFLKIDLQSSESMT